MTNAADNQTFSDLALSRRLERAEAQSNASFVEARARVQPESGATWIEVAGAYAMFDGVGSPLTQTFGLGVFDAVTEAEFERLESFFRSRGAEVFHEVSPMADPSILSLLGQRGYRPIELTSILYRPIGRGMELPVPKNPGIRVRRIQSDEASLWANTAAEGWSEFGELAAFMRDLGLVTAQRSDAPCFLAELDGKPIAAGTLSLHDGVALLAGASTIPSARGQGAQLALLGARLQYAAEQGCDLAMMGAAPGSASQRNAERQGFRIAYTRIKWQQVEPARA